jgi:hypothetical protein
MMSSHLPIVIRVEMMTKRKIMATPKSKLVRLPFKNQSNIVESARVAYSIE